VSVDERLLPLMLLLLRFSGDEMCGAGVAVKSVFFWFFWFFFFVFSVAAPVISFPPVAVFDVALDFSPLLSLIEVEVVVFAVVVTFAGLDGDALLKVSKVWVRLLLSLLFMVWEVLVVLRVVVALVVWTVLLLVWTA
jgi:hypothetical protein